MFVFTKIAGRIGTFILLIALTLISLVLTNRFSLSKPLKAAGEGMKNGAMTAAQKWNDYQDARRKRKREIYDQERQEEAQIDQEAQTEGPKHQSISEIIKGPIEYKTTVKFDKDEIEGTWQPSHRLWKRNQNMCPMNLSSHRIFPMSRQERRKKNTDSRIQSSGRGYCP